ncbi:MAG TPA: UDP-N-acetylmuramoyl-L-alanine--D-glutamate ligase [Acetobacteraceae bacterium]|nr:UDP-N-acetylmuramoyl-L-alanine--D-glutamate ligase [Acetobacteraceae bacterium]
MNGFAQNLFAGSRFAVMGLGRNGLPAAQALVAMGADVVAWDDAGGERDERSVSTRNLADGEFDFDALILSPGIPHRLPAPHPVAARAIAARVPILSDAELLFQAVRRSGSRARFVGITGTNGKSTTTALLAHILTCAGRLVAAGGNLGPAALGLPLLGDDGIYVLEMSSYMLERLVTLRFDVAAMLNLSADHLDRHGDMAGYTAAKRAVFDRQTAGDLAVVGVDDDGSRDLADWVRTRPARVVTISGSPLPIAGEVNNDSGVLRDLGGPLIDMAEAPALPGAHNAQNAAAAAAMAMALGVSRDDVARGIASYPGLAHRQQRIATIDGTSFVNDSKATNADAASRALGCYDRLIWIAGGQAKQGGIESLAPFFPRVARALLIGRDAPALAATLAAAHVPHEIVGTLDAAVPAAHAAARRAGAPVVLLSPACASFDQFSGFDARGDRFVALVHALAAAKAA